MVPQSIIEAFDPELSIERAWTPPSSWYTEPAVAVLEQDTVFRNSWQPVARIAQLAEPGSYTTGCFAGEPWVVVRGRDDQLRAFYNTCRHKGREVVTGSGRAEQLVCGYHAWAYDLDGRLRKAPRMAGIDDFERGAMSLPAMAVDTWGPWVFVSRDPAAKPVRTLVPELDAALEQGGWAKLRHVAERSWTIACNWKVYADNYLDGGYHVPHMHPSLAAQLHMDSYRTELFARHSVQSCGPAPQRSEQLDYDASERIGQRALYAWLYPNFMINRYGPCMDSNWIVPLGPDRCRVEYQFYFEEGRDAAAFVAASMEQADLTQQEDIAICESVQRGLRSESYDRGRYAPGVEMGEHHFHRLLAHDYRRGIGR